ncbi:MAG TPA: hypothetical protein VMU07_02930 [Candidatus Paceibacterota bacterium]|nr:hypothetical protein [Candidatus Paceibacterota bacterium]
MCDYSIELQKNRPARAGELLTIHLFDTGTRGFISPGNPDTAVCLLPGTKVLAATSCPLVPIGTQGEFVQIDRPPEAVFGYHRDAIKFEGVEGGPVLLQDLPTHFGIEACSIPKDDEGDITDNDLSELKEALVAAGSD